MSLCHVRHIYLSVEKFTRECNEPKTINLFRPRTNRRETIGGKFRLTAENIGEFNTRYENVPDWILPKQLSFINYNATVRVLHTDYDNFAILFSCRNLNQYSHLENSWLLTREQQPSEEVLQSAYGFLDKFGLRNYFVKSDQSKCAGNLSSEN